MTNRMQVWSILQKSMNNTYIKILKKQKLHKHLNRYRKAYDKIQYTFMIKTLNRLKA